MSFSIVNYTTPEKVDLIPFLEQFYVRGNSTRHPGITWNEIYSLNKDTLIGFDVLHSNEEWYLFNKCDYRLQKCLIFISNYGKLLQITAAPKLPELRYKNFDVKLPKIFLAGALATSDKRKSFDNISNFIIDYKSDFGDQWIHSEQNSIQSID